MCAALYLQGGQIGASALGAREPGRRVATTTVTVMAAVGLAAAGIQLGTAHARCLASWARGEGAGYSGHRLAAAMTVVASLLLGSLLAAQRAHSCTQRAPP